jgi:hypothetical protein
MILYKLVGLSATSRAAASSINMMTHPGGRLCNRVRVHAITGKKEDLISLNFGNRIAVYTNTNRMLFVLTRTLSKSIRY